MRLAIGIVCACLVLAASFVVYQVVRNLDGNEVALANLAKAYKDNRSVAQIKKDNALIRAAADGDAEGVRRSLKNGALVNSRYLDTSAFLDAGASGYTALMRASLAGHDEVVKILIEAKPNLELDRNHRTSLYMAVIAERESVVKLLVAAGAQGDPEQIRLAYDLLRAACRGFKMREGEGYPLYPGSIGNPDNAPEITEVLRRGADVNGADPGGFTSLMFAANLGLIENVKLLLANGADATLKTKDGQTALSMTERPDSSVARADRLQVVELLQAHLAKSE